MCFCDVSDSGDSDGLNIGGERSNSFQHFFNGDVAEIAIFTRSLSQVRVHLSLQDSQYLTFDSVRDSGCRGVYEGTLGAAAGSFELRIFSSIMCSTYRIKLSHSVNATERMHFRVIAEEIALWTA